MRVVLFPVQSARTVLSTHVGRASKLHLYTCNLCKTRCKVMIITQYEMPDYVLVSYAFVKTRVCGSVRRKKAHFL